MAEQQPEEQQQQQQQQHKVTAPFPTPPPFYQHFTKQNLARLRQLRKDAAASQTSTSEANSSQEAAPKNGSLEILSLPTELRYLIPPTPPQHDTEKYTSFGARLSLRAPDPTLTDSSIEQLYPSHPSVYTNPQPHLITLARSLLTTFLALVGTLSQNPGLHEERVDALQTICYNVHDLVNRYRPHQARESLILMMEERVEGVRGEMRRILEAKEKVGEVMRGLREGGEGVGMRGGGKVMVRKEGGRDAGERRRARQRAAWAALERDLAESGD